MQFPPSLPPVVCQWYHEEVSLYSTISSNSLHERRYQALVAPPFYKTRTRVQNPLSSNFSAPYLAQIGYIKKQVMTIEWSFEHCTSGSLIEFN